MLGIVFLSSVTSFYYFLVDNEFLLTLRLHCYNLYKYCSLSIDPLARLRGSLLNTLTARISDYLTFHIRTHHRVPDFLPTKRRVELMLGMGTVTVYGIGRTNGR